MRLPSFAEHYWQLESAEARAANWSDSFILPPRSVRESLTPGTPVQLLFGIETELPDGSLRRDVERMWVIVAERVGALYIGRLDNMPDSVEHAAYVYLSEGAEIPFGPEHVIAVDEWDDRWQEYVQSLDASRRWPRDTDIAPPS
jgi:hypothetical protein